MDFIILLIICISLGALGFEKFLFEIKRKRQQNDYQNINQNSDSWKQEH